MDDTYHFCCVTCEYLYHCYGRDVAQKIQEGDTEDMYELQTKCNDYYPDIMLDQ